MEQYYFTFYCDELCVDLECELEYEEAEPEVGLKDSMTLVSAIPKSALGDGTSSGLDILGIMKLSWWTRSRRPHLKTYTTQKWTFNHETRNFYNRGAAGPDRRHAGQRVTSTDSGDTSKS
jgi:hypothetical protein